MKLSEPNRPPATMTRTRVAEALFVSALEPSQNPSVQMIRDAIDDMIRRYGPDGCAARMAGEFGEHPDMAVRRMLWIRRIMDRSEELATYRR